MGDIEQARQDAEDMGAMVKKFGARDENIYRLDNATESETKTAYMGLMKKLAAGKAQSPQVDYLVIHAFAGHGVQDAGTQWLLYNEFHPLKKFYRMFGAENRLRVMAAEFPNSYHIGVFACCR